MRAVNRRYCILGFMLLLVLGSILSCISYLIYAYNPVQLIVNKVIQFYPDSIVFNLWKEPPFEIYDKIYIFNVSNAEEFLAGKEKLRFNEVGPYVYKEILYNENPVFHDNGTVSFIPRRNVEFIPELSVGDPTVDTLILPNVPLLGITASLKDESMLINLAVSSISTVLGSEAFLNLTIYEYLYGYEDTLVTLANQYVSNWIDFPRFGILDRFLAMDNASDIVTLNVNPEMKMSNTQLLTEKERSQLFSIQKWAGSSGLRQWGYKDSAGNETIPGNSRCNLVEGSFMGTLFPRNIEKNSTFKLYRKAFCRSIPIVYEGTEVTSDGFEGYSYKLQRNFLDRPEENPENSCYHKSNEFIPNGLGDISGCYYDIPITLSQPHFLNADPSITEKIDGMLPNVDKHDLNLLVHPKIGLPLKANLRLQINLRIPVTNYNSKTIPFNNLVIPLFWVDLCVNDIPPTIKLYIKLMYHILPTTQTVIMYLLAVIGVFMILGSSLAAVLPNIRSRGNSFLHVNYSEIPVFSLKEKVFHPELLIKK